MLRLGKKTEECKACIPFKGFKVMVIIVIGTIIGIIATEFVQTPASTRLLVETQHDRDTTAIMNKLNIMAKNVLLIRKDILSIKRKFEDDADNIPKGE